MINKSICVLVCVFFVFAVFIKYSSVRAANKLDGISNFPKSYQPYLTELAKRHPNWNFIALYTNLDWNYAVNQENIFGKNLVPKNYSDAWKNTDLYQYNVEVDNGWVDSSREAIEYCMDPRNFLNDVRIFQFEELSYNSNFNSLNGIEKILYGTEFYNRSVSYYDVYGNLISMQEKYSDLILKAGQVSCVSPYHLASRIKQEIGAFLTHSSISGQVQGFEGLYNFYNIGATSSAEPMGAIMNGLWYARDGKGATDEIKNRYLIPWNTKEKAITGGAIFIGSSYINVGQNTIYLQKFDVNDLRSYYLFSHQYMTNVLAPYSEAKSIYNGYYNSGLLDMPMSFIIPVYESMPEIPTQNPNINPDDFIQVNTNAYCNATNVNVRTGPSNSYEVITTIPYQYKMTVIEKGIQVGEKWDKVILENGIVGFIYQSYVTEENGIRNIEESELLFIAPLRINNLEISGIDYINNTVMNIKQKIITDLEVEFINNKNKVLTEKDLIGTGTKVRIKEDGLVLREYTIVLYGDINGDGKINSADLLILQRHILEIERLEAIYTKAGNINKNGRKPTSMDLLVIQRHILGLKILEQ